MMVPIPYTPSAPMAVSTPLLSCPELVSIYHVPNPPIARILSTASNWVSNCFHLIVHHPIDVHPDWYTQKHSSRSSCSIAIMLGRWSCLKKFIFCPIGLAFFLGASRVCPGLISIKTSLRSSRRCSSIFHTLKQWPIQIAWTLLLVWERWRPKSFEGATLL